MHGSFVRDYRMTAALAIIVPKMTSPAPGQALIRAVRKIDMQPVNGPGAPLPGERAVGTTTSAAPVATAGDGGDPPLTPAQRATLENLIVKIAALSTLKAADIWNGVKQRLGLTENAELSSRHYQPAEQLLQTQLTAAQKPDDSGRQQLMQRLTAMLPEGDNRQAVSDFIRRQFGHTVLSSLDNTQLQQVVALLQHGRAPQSTANAAAAQPQPAASAPERPLLPAERDGLNQLIVRLAAQSGEPAAKIWASLMTMQNLTAGDAVPVKNLPLLTQFLQAQIALRQAQTLSPPPQTATTPASAANAGAPNPPAANGADTAAGASGRAAAASLALLQSVLPHPISAPERQMLLEHMQTALNAGAPAPLTPAQLGEALAFLFSQRLQPSQPAGWTAPQPLLNPLIAALPPNWQALWQKPMLTVIIGICVALFLLWVLF
ncbi:flagella biosynthesis regulator Flk [Brenneria populi]|uniref:Flagella biosynthesis regulator Flk n=1 Tax=Brenneria populi TaxID=1505588 RepID=A0ABU6JSX9_9GAMM|nr:flagella biosynthesis regulator Flk [Brenneria populi Li et al. 2015]